METTLTDRGQTAVPSRIRKRFSMKPGQKLEWIEDGKMIYLIPKSLDPVAAFRGSSKNTGLSEALLKARREDKSR